MVLDESLGEQEFRRAVEQFCELAKEEESTFRQVFPGVLADAA